MPNVHLISIEVVSNYRQIERIHILRNYLHKTCWLLGVILKCHIIVEWQGKSLMCVRCYLCQMNWTFVL